MNKKSILADWFIDGIKNSISVDYVVNTQQDHKIQTRITKQNTVHGIDQKKYCFVVSRNINFDENVWEDSNGIWWHFLQIKMKNTILVATKI